MPLKRAFLFLLLILPPNVFSQTGGEASHSLSLSAEAGFLYGTSYEIVYHVSGSSEYLSELQWKIEPLWFIGMAAEYAPKQPFNRQDFFGTLDIKLGIPGKTGVIEDRDWLEPGVLTHFSSHDNLTKMALLVDLGAGISVPLTAGFLLRFSLDLSYMYFKYEAHDGYTQYGSNTLTSFVAWKPSFPKVSFNGLAMDYAQHWFILRPGVGTVLRKGPVFLSLSISLSPLTVCVAIDNHYRRDPPFMNLGGLTGGIFVEPEAGVSFAFNEQCKIGLVFAYRYISETRGNAVYYEYHPYGTVVKEYADTEGARYRAFEAALKFTYTL
jgi:outer membrane protease